MSFMLSVKNKPIMLSVIMLSVVAPLFELVTAGANEKWHFV